MLRNARFINVKALRDLEISLAPFTVIVGPNASGKTSILRSLRLVGRLADPLHSPLAAGIPNLEDIRTHDATDAMHFKVDGTLGGKPTDLELKISEFEDFQKPSDFVLRATWQDRHIDHVQAFRIRPKKKEVERGRARYATFLDGEGAILREITPRATFLRLNASRMSTASYSDEKTPSLQEDGSAFGALLAHIALVDRTRYDRIVDAVRAVIPAVHGLRLEREKVPRSDPELWGHKLIIDFESSPDTPAEEASEGTLLVIGIITAVLSIEHPNLILIDDIDKGLHPKAIVDLIAQLRRILVENPDLQIIATTHSPYLIDNFEGDEIRLTTMSPTAGVVCGRLSDHPDFARWRETMLAGEFWSMVGERWLLEPRAQAHAVP